MMRKLPSLEALRFFDEAAQHLSFNKAADALCVTQGAVSRQIKNLEAHLGGPLFVRDSRGVKLTALGEQFLPHVSRGFDALDLGVKTARLSAGQVQKMVLCVPPTFATQWLSPRLPSLLKLLNHNNVSIKTGEEESGDFYIRFQNGSSDHKTKNKRCVMIEHHCLVGAPELAGKSVRHLMENFPALHVLHHEHRLDFWQNWLRHAALPEQYAQHGIEFSNLEQVIHAARQKVGLAIIDANMIEQELQQKSLVVLSELVFKGPFGYWLEGNEMQQKKREYRILNQWLDDQCPVESVP
jgi:DNA-binding transcriptional LysR family regulator